MKKKVPASKKGRVLQGFVAIFMAITVFACYLYAGLDRTFSYLTFYCVLGGAAIGFLSAFIPGKIGEIFPIIVTILYAVGFAQHLVLGLETLSDIWNEVSFVGGNAAYVVLFGAPMAFGLLLQILSCFMGGDKKYVKVKVKVEDL